MEEVKKNKEKRGGRKRERDERVRLNGGEKRKRGREGWRKIITINSL